MAVAIAFNEPITRLLGNPGFSKWLYVLPASILLLVFFQFLNYGANRARQYRRIASSLVV